MARQKSPRRAGREVKTALWLGRHPGSVLTPTAVGAAGMELGWTATGGIVGGALVGLCGWYRAHPDTFDAWAAPRMRAWRRRWSAYLGPRWANALRACDLVGKNRKTGEELVPRITKVQAFTPNVETLHVKIAPGQHVRHWEAKLPELTEALKAERIAVERVKPLVIGLVIQRSEPFTDVIPAPEMPNDVDAVDVADLYVGDDEYGGDVRLGVQGGKHLFIAGATGSGKNSIPAAMLRGLVPLIREGLVRLWICDPKQLEFARLAPIAHRYATDTGECVGLVEDFVADMQHVQRSLSATGQRKATMSRETPLNVLVLDELGTLLAYGDSGHARELRKLLALVGSQGRATQHSMIGLVQEPTKDTVPVRELFTVRVCLRVTSALHVDMTLGDGTRLRGALADEIPDGEDTAGIGYLIRQRSRIPLRFRAAYTSDAELDELVTFVRTGQPDGLRAVA